MVSQWAGSNSDHVILMLRRPWHPKSGIPIAQKRFYTSLGIALPSAIFQTLAPLLIRRLLPQATGWQCARELSPSNAWAAMLPVVGFADVGFADVGFAGAGFAEVVVSIGCRPSATLRPTGSAYVASWWLSWITSDLFRREIAGTEADLVPEGKFTTASTRKIQPPRHQAGNILGRVQQSAFPSINRQIRDQISRRLS